MVEFVLGYALDWRAVDSPKKRTDEFDLFAVKSRKQTKQVRPFIF